MGSEEKQARAFAAAVFSTIGLFAAVVGGHDAFGALEVGSRFGGLLMLLAGSALITVAAVLLVRSLEWAIPVGIFASAVGAMIGISLLLGNLLSPDRSRPPAIAVLALGVALLVAVFVFDLTPKLLVPIAGFALLVAFVVFGRGDHDERLVIWAAFVFARPLRPVGCGWCGRRSSRSPRPDCSRGSLLSSR